MTESGRLCAFITKVRKGSLADTVGHLRPGINTHTDFFLCVQIQSVDICYIFSMLKMCQIQAVKDFRCLSGVFAGDQVLEWNGKLLQGATFKEVYNIILESKPEPQVELVVSRPIG